MYTQASIKHPTFARILGGKWVAPIFCKFYKKFAVVIFNIVKEKPNYLHMDQTNV